MSRWSKAEKISGMAGESSTVGLERGDNGRLPFVAGSQSRPRVGDSHNGSSAWHDVEPPDSSCSDTMLHCDILVLSIPRCPSPGADTVGVVYRQLGDSAAVRPPHWRHVKLHSHQPTTSLSLRPGFCCCSGSARRRRGTNSSAYQPLPLPVGWTSCPLLPSPAPWARRYAQTTIPVV